MELGVLHDEGMGLGKVARVARQGRLGDRPRRLVACADRKKAQPGHDTPGVGVGHEDRNAVGVEENTVRCLKAKAGNGEECSARWRARVKCGPGFSEAQ